MHDITGPECKQARTDVWDMDVVRAGLARECGEFEEGSEGSGHGRRSNRNQEGPREHWQSRRITCELQDEAGVVDTSKGKGDLSTKAEKTKIG
eukprot:1545866-Pleurochrysis_carterae.AAC.5